MSKASEWAATQPGENLAVTFRPNHPHQSGLALVERSGDLYLELSHASRVVVGATLTPSVALALARWILDTFGEPE